MSVKRVSISKKIRFEVFKRDDFKCQYCGSTPPNITLEIDHIKPVSKGGTNDINNLVTSCFNCNRGKSNIELKTLPNQLNDNIEILREKEEQLKEYHKLIRNIENRNSRNIQKVTDRFESYYPEKTLAETFKNVSLRTFVKKLDVYDVLESLDKAYSKMHNSESTLKYFCGICWNKIKGVTPDWKK